MGENGGEWGRMGGMGGMGGLGGMGGMGSLSTHTKKKLGSEETGNTRKVSELDWMIELCPVFLPK